MYLYKKSKNITLNNLLSKKLEYSLKKAQLISSLYLTIPHPKIEKKTLLTSPIDPLKNPKNPFKFPTHKYSWIYTLIM